MSEREIKRKRTRMLIKREKQQFKFNYELQPEARYDAVVVDLWFHCMIYEREDGDGDGDGDG